MWLVIESRDFFFPSKTQETISHKHIEKSTNTEDKNQTPHRRDANTNTHTQKRADWEDNV